MKFIFKNGKFKDLPELRKGELAFANDFNRWYIGTADGNMEFYDFNLLSTNLEFFQGSNTFIGLSEEGYAKFIKNRLSLERLLKKYLIL